MFISTPVSPAVTPEPHPLFKLWIAETAFPSASTTQKYVVSPAAAATGSSIRAARRISIRAANPSACASDNNRSNGTLSNRGSAPHRSRSTNASFFASTSTCTRSAGDNPARSNRSAIFSICNIVNPVEFGPVWLMFHPRYPIPIGCCTSAKHPARSASVTIPPASAIPFTSRRASRPR